MGKIYFHADDYGRSKEVSKNILNCIINGNINSVSIMVNHEQKYHNKLKKFKNINKRLHINLTEIPKKSIKDYHLNKLTFLKLLFLNEAKKQKILNEIDKQIIKFKKIYKPKELKIDGHEHVHMIPWILDHLLKSKIHYKIVELRNSNEKLMMPRLKDLFNPKYIRNLIACLVVKFLYNFNKRPKLNAPQFSGILYSGIQSLETVKKTLFFFKSNNYKNCEILIHPGYTNKKEKFKFKKNYFEFYNSKNRKEEFNLCFSKELKKQLNQFK